MATQVNYVDIDTRSINLPLVSSAKTVSATYRDRTTADGKTALGVRHPSLYYCENVLPTKTGIKAVSTLTYSMAGELDLTDSLFLEELPTVDADNVPAIFLVLGTKLATTTIVNLFSYNPASGVLPEPKLVTSFSFPAAPSTTTKYHVTHNVLNGVSIISVNARYITFSGIRKSYTKVFEVVSNKTSPSTLNDITASLALVTNNVDTITSAKKESEVIQGFLYSNGYFIGYTTLSIAWSSPSDLLNFTPGITTGAGAGSIVGVKGRIVSLVNTEIGFNVYCTGGIVSARVSANTAYPFTFKLLTHDMGVSNAQQITKGTSQFVLSSAGLITVNTSISKVAGDIVDFLASGRYESYENDSITVVKTDSPPVTRLAFVGARYLCISYKLKDSPYFDYVLVYDIVLNAYGKLKIPHVLVHSVNFDILGDFLTYSEIPDTYTELDEVSYTMLMGAGINDSAQVGHTLGIINSVGHLSLVSPTLENNTAKGIAIFGKFSIKDNIQTMLDGFFIESVPEEKTLSTKVLTSYNGTAKDKVTEPYEIIAGDTREYKCRVTGNTHSVVLSGAFELNRLNIGIRGVGYR